jgi:hypothetical protein
MLSPPTMDDEGPTKRPPSRPAPPLTDGDQKEPDRKQLPLSSAGELMSFVSAHYRVSDDAAHIGIGGTSAGLLSPCMSLSTVPFCSAWSWPKPRIYGRVQRAIDCFDCVPSGIMDCGLQASAFLVEPTAKSRRSRLTSRTVISLWFAIPILIRRG